LKVVFIGPMLLPIPCEKGAVEEIIWQVSRRLKKYMDISIFNPITLSHLKRILAGASLAFRSGSKDAIIHSHNLYASLGLATLPVNTKHIITLHYPPWITRSSSRGMTLLSILRMLDMRGVVIVSPSIAVAEFLIRKELRNVVYIPNGVDTEMFNPAKRSQEVREKLLDGKDVLIVNVARIHPDKNQLAALKALRCVVSEQKDVKMVFAGSTSGSFTAKDGLNWYYLTLLRYVEKHSLKPYVDFLGEIPTKRDVATILASSDIYIHPSKVEAAPLAILEAMASGLPVIAFDLPFYRGYLINNVNALLTPLDNEKELCGALLELVVDTNLRRKLAYNALKHSQGFFSWDIIVRKHYLPLYRELMES